MNSHPLLMPLLQFLSWDAAGLAFALAVAAVGALLWWRRLRWPAYVLWALALLLAVGSASHLRDAASIAARHPAPGRFVQVAGMRIHLLAEGKRTAGRPTVVWFGGGHSGGGAMWHLHREMRGELRSVLIDRPGTGWSGAATFPRTTDREASEMWQTLAAAGERGPYVLVGHSFGGMLAAKMAQGQPKQVAALVLLDATPPDVIVYGPDLGASQLASTAFKTGLARLFGLDLDQKDPARALDPVERAMNEQLGRYGDALRAQSTLPRSQMAAASIYGELSPSGMAERAWQTTLYEGELNGKNVYLVAPNTLPPAMALPGNSRDQIRLLNLLMRGRERYMAVSDRSRRIVAPAGTGHNFIYESPQTVIDAVRLAAGGTRLPPR